MERKKISTGSRVENEVGYSRAVIDGEWAFLSGTTGYNYKNMFISNDIVEQTEQCIKNINDTLTEAGFSFKDIMRVMYILPDKNEFEKCWPVLKKHFGEIRPAATMISAGLATDEMKIEIEATAKKNTSN